MSSIPFFVSRLSLPWDADERAVRRAYARELKLIDQERDPEGFQRLREAYDAALRWARQAQHSPASQTVQVSVSMQDTQPAAESAAAPSTVISSAPVDASQDPRALASAVLELTLDRLTKVPPNAEHAEKLLHKAFADERLQSVDARDLFEYMVAATLAQGWRPGHEALFSAAPKFFSWTDDRRRLLRFGQVGGVMDAAITQLMVFNDIKSAARETCMDLIRRLRTDGDPQRAQLKRGAPVLDYLVAHYPSLLPIITNADHLDVWRQRAEAFRNAKDTKAFAKSTVENAPTQQQEKTNWKPIFFGIWIVFMAFRSLTGSNSSSAPEPRPAPVSVYQGVSSQPLSNAADPVIPGYAQSPSLSAAAAARTAATLTSTRELPPLSKEQIRAASTGKPDSENCTRLAAMVHDYGMGTPAAMAKFGRDTERQILNCVVAKQWIYRFPWGSTKDPAVEVSLAHMNDDAMRDTKPLKATKLYDVDFPAPPTPASPAGAEQGLPSAEQAPAVSGPSKRVGNYELGASSQYDPASMRLLDRPIRSRDDEPD